MSLGIKIKSYRQSIHIALADRSRSDCIRKSSITNQSFLHSSPSSLSPFASLITESRNAFASHEQQLTDSLFFLPRYESSEYVPFVSHSSERWPYGDFITLRCISSGLKYLPPGQITSSAAFLSSNCRPHHRHLRRHHPHRLDCSCYSPS